MSIEFTKSFYLKIENDYIIDVIRYSRDGYVLFEEEEIPEDIMNGCYRFIENKIVLDEEKYKENLEIE